MSDFNQLVEQHIKMHQSHLKHLDELFGRADEKTTKGPEHSEINEQLAVLRRERNKLAGHLDELKLRSPEYWKEEQIVKTGPMGMWDAVAQQLETLTERLERK